MPKIKLIGRTNDFCGKTLWEIVGNLKNFGVGRLVMRNRFNRYPEPCFSKIVKVEVEPEPAPNYEDRRKVHVWTEKIWRGRRYPDFVELFRASPKADYRLVPRTEEQALWDRVKATPPVVKMFSRTESFPPLLREMIKQEMAEKGIPVTEDPQLPAIIRVKKVNIARYVEDGETPTHHIEPTFATVEAPRLYQNIDR